MDIISSSPVVDASPATFNPRHPSPETIAVPDALTRRYTLAQGPDAGWDIYIRKDHGGVKVDKPLWRNLGFGRENRPSAPPPIIAGYEYRGETTRGDVSTLIYAPADMQTTVSGTSPNSIENPNDDAWANHFPFGPTNTLARTLRSSPAQSPEGSMYAHAQPVGAVVEIKPDGQVKHLGTGFLAYSPYDGDSTIYVVTNDHVISTSDGPGRRELWLGYENPNAPPKERIELSGRPAENAGLDYAIFRVREADKAKALSFNPLKPGPPGTAFVGDDIYMPNHASGSVKGISYRDGSGKNAKILKTTSDLGSRYPHQVLMHNAFNSPGTSGSPIIDRRSNKVIALNFGGIGLGRAVNLSTVWSDARPQLQRGT
jgi:hypothetical protein